MATVTAPIDTCPVKAANPPRRAALGNGLPTWRCATSVAGTVINWSPPHRKRSDSRPSSSKVRVELTKTEPPGFSPAKRSTWCTSVGSITMTQSGSMTGSLVRISRSCRRQ